MEISRLVENASKLLGEGRKGRELGEFEGASLMLAAVETWHSISPRTSRAGAAPLIVRYQKSLNIAHVHCELRAGPEGHSGATVSGENRFVRGRLIHPAVDSSGKPLPDLLARLYY